jgi:serine/threonine-protein kinase RsbW/stage II sporulation protein AB (anti-sigma F factor)
MDVGETQKLIRTYGAAAATVPAARGELTDFALAAGATQEELGSIRLAVSEALTNAVLHAYRGRPGQVYVSAAVAGDELWVLIGDDGAGLHAGGSSPGLGMGLALIAELSDSFSVVNRSSGGTEVRMRFSLHRQPAPRGGGRGGGDQSVRPSAASAACPASSSFSMTK